MTEPKRCPECRFLEGDHAFACSVGQESRTLEQWRRWALAFAESVERRDGRIRRLRELVTLWQGKHAILCRENNALRRMVVAEPRATEGPDAYLCPQCGPGVGVDEDGCCAACGADTTTVSQVRRWLGERLEGTARYACRVNPVEVRGWLDGRFLELRVWLEDNPDVRVPAVLYVHAPTGADAGRDGDPAVGPHVASGEGPGRGGPSPEREPTGGAT
jgi:hypothetical protein